METDRELHNLISLLSTEVFISPHSDRRADAVTEYITLV